MFQIDVMSRKPVYEQLVDQVERYVLMGILVPEEQIPSVRSLSVELSVNPNTIQKAFAELDRRHIVYSVPGKGCFICRDAAEQIGLRRRQNLEGLRREVGELALAGIPKKMILDCVEEAYRKYSGDKRGENGYDSGR